MDKDFVYVGRCKHCMKPIYRNRFSGEHKLTCLVHPCGRVSAVLLPLTDDRIIIGKDFKWSMVDLGNY